MLNVWRCAKGGREQGQENKKRGWNVWNSWQIWEKYYASAAMGCFLVFWRVSLSSRSHSWFSSSQTPWGTLRHSYGSVSVITLCWHGLKRAREIEAVIDLACPYKWVEIELTVCLVSTLNTEYRLLHSKQPVLPSAHSPQCFNTSGNFQYHSVKLP